MSLRGTDIRRESLPYDGTNLSLISVFDVLATQLKETQTQLSALEQLMQTLRNDLREKDVMVATLTTKRRAMAQELQSHSINNGTTLRHDLIV